MYTPPVRTERRGRGNTGAQMYMYTPPVCAERKGRVRRQGKKKKDSKISGEVPPLSC